jgi:2-oxoisovalerate dehydrogenase E2 component (dihydrolipoyl transacylase)
MGTTRIIKLPDIGEGVAEAELIGWLVKVGDLIREDQPLAEVMTDKATVEIPSPAAGTVVALGGEVGAKLAVGGELVRLAVPDGADRAAPEAAPAPQSKPATIAVPAPPTDAVSAKPAQPAAAGERRTHLESLRGDKPTASPAVRKRARDSGVDLREVRGGGPAGRILHEDIEAYLRGREAAAPGPGGRKPDTRVEEIKVVGLRRRIAEAMAESTRRIAHFSYVEEVDLTALEELRAALNVDPDAAGRDRTKLTLLPFLMLAMVKAVAEFPQMNAHYDDEAEVVRRHGAVHIGIATQTPSGLMVPVARHAEARDLWNCASEVKRLADAARGGRATREELSGSTITVTSLGALGGVASTPVINRPEVAIVGVNRMAVRPVWQDGGVVPRKMMNLSSSFDHRVIDGYDAAGFIQRIKRLLETPAMIFMAS